MGLRDRLAALSSERRAQLAIAVLIGLGTLIRIPQLFHTLLEAYSFRQTQTAFVVREYAQNGIDLFRTPLPVFGAGSDVPMEFPLWQGIAALLDAAGLPTDLAVRILALVSFQAVAVLLAALLMRWHGRLVAVVAVGLFQFLPFGLLWGAASLIDFFAVAASLLMVYGIDRWLHERSIGWLVAGGLAAIVGFLVKVTTVPSWGLLLVVSVVLLVVERGWRGSWRRIVVATIGPLIGLASAVAWTAYADSVKRAEPITQFLTSSALTGWNFGTVGQRVDPANYAVIVGRVAGEIAGPALITLLLALVAAIFAPSTTGRWKTVGWLAVAVSAPLVFFNLYVVHSYYLIAVYPAIVAAMAIGLIWLLRVIPGSARQRTAIGVVAIAVLFISTVATDAGRGDVAQYARSGGVPAVSEQIRESTQAGDLVVTVGCDWDPTWLYYAERGGAMFRDADAGDFWDEHDIEAYSIVLRCGETADPQDYLPEGYTTAPTRFGQIFEIVRD